VSWPRGCKWFWIFMINKSFEEHFKYKKNCVHVIERLHKVAKEYVDKSFFHVLYKK